MLINKGEKDEDTLVLASKWSNYETQMVEIMEPSITQSKRFISFKHLGQIQIANLKQIPARPTDKNDHHIEGSWLRFIGREYKGLAEVLKHDMVIFGQKLPLNALVPKVYFWEPSKDRDREEFNRRAQT